MLDVKYDDIILTDDYNMSSSSDTIYSMVAILKKMEKLGERYLVLGELRADLLEISENASKEMQDVYNFEIDESHPYANTRDYYEVINRCNLLIAKADTSIISQGKKVLMKEFAHAKAIRAWTYLQLVLNHGEAFYYEKPLLSVQDAEKVTEKVALSELLPLLIADLEPFQKVEIPGSISLGEDIANSRKMLFPIQIVLGDLYLYNQQYDNAAQVYYDLMNEKVYLSLHYTLEWSVDNKDFNGITDAWSSMFNPKNEEYDIISFIGGSNEYGTQSRIDSLFAYNRELIPAKPLLNAFEEQTYYHTPSITKKGDLRGLRINYYDLYFDGMVLEEEVLYNYKAYAGVKEKSWAIPVYRIGSLYLKYAESVNRAGKPSLAFAVLKHGLKPDIIENDSIVVKQEKNPLAPYMDFSTKTFTQISSFGENIIGIHARGSGNVRLVSDYRIPHLPSLQDSINYVEDQIMNEYVLETYLEGNRFHDLIRLSLRRGSEAYLADRVSKKYQDREDQVRTLLMDQKNWYIPNK